VNGFGVDGLQPLPSVFAKSIGIEKAGSIRIERVWSIYFIVKRQGHHQGKSSEHLS
jgi:hypothetical protein